MTDPILDLELKIFGALEGLHTKTDELLRMQRNEANEILAIKQRQNRHGRKIEKLEALDVRIRVLERDRAPSSRPSPSPDDTAPHEFTDDELARLRSMADADRKDSEFRRLLPRTVAMRTIAIVATACVSASVATAFTYLMSHR